ncbi:hypothetical protein C2G38_2203395 [Gigaspora rosea]|uniref:Uncharacterized protein n=1 Tax=Gigaspora rosea TaxID=44941 RepID=A0A397URN3_9GLOM|nr:hypothetical protein C2G38_2203395 [Gigaspora rosea]
MLELQLAVRNVINQDYYLVPKKLLETDCQILSQFLNTILYTCETAFHDTSFATPSRQYYKSDEISEHEYNYENDSVFGPSNFNQELNIYNIDDESDDNMQSDKSSKSVRSNKSDQENENEINKIDNTCPNNPEKDTKDPTPLDTTRPLRSKKNLPNCKSCANLNNPTKRKGQRSFIKGKKVKSLHK